jgi:uncharacterized protein YceK
MRILLTLLVMLLSSGCTSMLLGGSGTYKQPTDQCQERQGEDQKREC